MSTAITDQALELARHTIVRRVITTVAVVASALLQAFLIQAFVNPANLLPSGFTGIAVLIDRITLHRPGHACAQYPAGHHLLEPYFQALCGVLDDASCTLGALPAYL